MGFRMGLGEKMHRRDPKRTVKLDVGARRSSRRDAEQVIPPQAEVSAMQAPWREKASTISTQTPILPWSLHSPTKPTKPRQPHPEYD